MPIDYVQILYAIFANAAIVVGIRTLLTDHFPTASWANKKPLSCSYCLSFWCAWLTSMWAVDMYAPFVDKLIVILVIHICSYMVTQRLN